MKLAKGYYGRRKNVWTVAKNAIEKGLQYAYSGRKQKKRNYRSLWIVRINAATRAEGLKYSEFVNGLKKRGIEVDRSVISNLAITDKAAFSALVAEAKTGLGRK
jgi:large subunit ribosomal protein L20